MSSHVVTRNCFAFSAVIFMFLGVGAEARYICTPAISQYEFSPLGGCNLDKNGDQLLEHHDVCTCRSWSRSCTDDVSGRSYGSAWITCSATTAPPPPTPPYTGLEHWLQQSLAASIKAPDDPTRANSAATRKRIARCRGGFADIIDSTGTPIEPLGACAGGDWSAELPANSFEIIVDGLHYPAVADCEAAKASFISSFRTNAALRAGCKARVMRAVPVGLLRVECSAGTKVNGFPGGSVIRVIVECQ